MHIEIIDIIAIIDIIIVPRSPLCLQLQWLSLHIDPVSVIADAENRSKTLAYQTVSGCTTKAP